MDILIEEQFDIEDEIWTIECERFLRSIQNTAAHNVTRIEKEPSDEKHCFLPKYLKSVEDDKFYEWDLKNFDDILVAIFQFLHLYYPDINNMKLSTIHKEKIDKWENIEFPKKLKNKDEKKEGELQNKVINEVNDKWFPGFEYLYDFEYERGNHKGDLIFANNCGILAAVETKRVGYNLIQKNKIINKVKEQTIKYRNILMEETKDDPGIITVFGVNKRFKNNSPDSDQQSVAQTVGEETLNGVLSDEENQDDDQNINEINDNFNEVSLEEKN
ncbi:hypothetical protein C2G38_2255933 [Gigaspora rosea]|uniref:Uncharacterized protein n=1 Tax=Gigaspora rosea TaxID=44941 RepID=A0A397U485_9GLOM|nr:hypothetical protein C2G38_2255933 [Gigaspora rosea]CAG8512636.1 724_t:CDS:2 [Gigaspora rosea]